MNGSFLVLHMKEVIGIANTTVLVLHMVEVRPLDLASFLAFYYEYFNCCVLNSGFHCTESNASDVILLSKIRMYIYTI